MTTDRELLELADKATGIRITFRKGVLCVIESEHPNGPFWNPLVDDGDALRLAVRLSLCITHATDGRVLVTSHDLSVSVTDTCTRRAIVRAAIEIGKATK